MGGFKESSAATLPSDGVGLRAKTGSRDKEEHRIRTKHPIHQEDTAALRVCA